MGGAESDERRRVEETKRRRDEEQEGRRGGGAEGRRVEETKRQRDEEREGRGVGGAEGRRTKRRTPWSPRKGAKTSAEFCGNPPSSVVGRERVTCTGLRVPGCSSAGSQLCDWGRRPMTDARHRPLPSILGVLLAVCSCIRSRACRVMTSSTGRASCLLKGGQKRNATLSRTFGMEITFWLAFGAAPGQRRPKRQTRIT